MLRVTVVQNKRTGRYHPFFWRMAPPPSHDDRDTVMRHKSHCHHTAGFETAEDADAFVKENKAPADIYTPSMNTTDYWL